MGWLTGYSYRQSIPVANPSAVGNRALDSIPFPAWFLKSQGSILGSAYEDVHVTTADGTTELPCALNSAKNSLFVDYASMPQGRTRLYVYYGKSGATAPTAPTFASAARRLAGVGGTLVDAGFEGRSDGTALDTSIWAVTGTPTHAEYDTARSVGGSASMWLAGQTATTSAGEACQIAMTSDGAELHFWAYFDSTNKFRYLDDVWAGTGASDRAFALSFNTSGQVLSFTQRAVTGYTQNASTVVGTYTTGWTQFRMVFDFTAQRFTLSSRTDVGSAWTQMKASGAADYNIPFRGSNTISTTHGALFRCIYDATPVNWWIDDLRYFDADTTTAQALSAGGEVTSEGDTAPRYYVFGDDLDFCEVDSGSPDTYHGGSDTATLGALAEQVAANYFTNSTASRFGATRDAMEPVDTSAAATLTDTGRSSITAYLYTCTSDGTLSSILATANVSLTGNVSKAARTANMTVSSDIDIPTGGGVVLRVQAGSSATVVKYWYSQVESGQTLSAGTYAITLTYEVASWNGTSGTLTLHYGDGQSYAPVSLFDVGASSLLTEKHHLLIKHFEGALPKGTVSGASMFLHTGTPTGSGDLRAHRLKTYGTSSSVFTTAVLTGWSNQTARECPTWNTRFYDQQGLAAVGWDTPGAAGTNEIDSTEYVTLSVSSGASAGYKELTLDADWLNAWQGDDYSQGIVIKHSTETGSPFHLDVSAPTTENGPVLVVDYSDIAADQLSERKVSTDSYHYAVFPIQGKYSITPSDNAFGILIYADMELGMSVVAVDSDGTMRRIVKSSAPTTDGRLSRNSPLFGIYYDESTGRYWTGGTGITADLHIAYSEPYDPTRWTWDTQTSIYTGKSSLSPRDGICHIFTIDITGSLTPAESFLSYLTYEPGVGFSTKVDVVDTIIDTKVDLAVAIGASDVMDGSGTITADGATSDYLQFGVLLIDSEKFWYTGRTGSTFTGVTRSTHGTTAASHSIGALIDQPIGTPTYTTIAHDEVNACLHVAWSVNQIAGGVTTYEYQAVGYLRHDYADGATVWRGADGNTITLPISPKDIPLASTAESLGFINNLVATSQGDVLVSYGCISYMDGNYLTLPTRIARLANGDTEFTQSDHQPNVYTALIDLGAGNVGKTSVSTTQQLLSLSSDGGQTWDTPTAIATHAFHTRGISNNGISSSALLDGLGISYYQHFTSHGAVYMNAVELPSFQEITAASSSSCTVSATIEFSQSFTAECAGSAFVFTDFYVPPLYIEAGGSDGTSSVAATPEYQLVFSVTSAGSSTTSASSALHKEFTVTCAGSSNVQYAIDNGVPSSEFTVTSTCVSSASALMAPIVYFTITCAGTSRVNGYVTRPPAVWVARAIRAKSWSKPAPPPKIWQVRPKG